MLMEISNSHQRYLCGVSKMSNVYYINRTVSCLITVTEGAQLQHGLWWEHSVWKPCWGPSVFAGDIQRQEQRLLEEQSLEDWGCSGCSHASESRHAEGGAMQQRLRLRSPSHESPGAQAGWCSKWPHKFAPLNYIILLNKWVRFTTN